MGWFRRKPLITDQLYGELMTSFGRVVDLDPLVAGPAGALADRVLADQPEAAAAFDRTSYEGSARYHLRLLGGAWILVAEGQVPAATAEVFVEAIAWRFRPGGKAATKLPVHLSDLARRRGPKR